MSGDDLLQVRCPECGSSEHIVGLDTIMATAGIIGWTRNEKGELEPEWSGNTDVDWDSQSADDEDYPYYCTSCGTHLSAAQLEEIRHEE